MKYLSLAAVASTVVLSVSQVASAHPGHEGHGLAPAAPIGEITVIVAVAHAILAGVWIASRRARAGRRV